MEPGVRLMSVENGEQLLLAALSMLSGMLLGFFYDVFGVFRRSMPEWLGIIWDGIYLFLTSLALFALAQGAGTGEFRLFILAAALIGVFLYRVTVMHAVRRALDTLAALPGVLWRKIRSAWKNSLDFFKKIGRKIKKVLCKPEKLVYNNRQESDAEER